MKQEKIYLKDYSSPAFSVLSTHLDFNLNEESSIVTATTQYKKLKDQDLVLNGLDFKLVSITLNNKILSSADYEKNEELLTIKNLPSEFTLVVVTELKPQDNTSLEGLYKSNGIFCTQCEAQGFRKITYFMDRPDVMTTYSVTIEADKTKYPILLSNGDRLKIEDLGNGRHKAYWRDPHKKPCYLFALVAGDMGLIQDTFTTASGRKVNLEVYAAHGKQDRCWHAMASLKKSMKWDEETFGLEYDLNDYMIVAIDDFNAGAMENKGLNIFNSRLVLADKNSATDDDFHAIESVVAHEYFHNWTGNRVTLREWFQLSLKEGLTVFRDQEFSADVTDRGVQRINDVERLRTAQFAEDAGPNSHPVRPESCMAVDNFFTMTIYEKGAEVIRMMQNIVGRKGFRKGMDEYFKRHDGQAVTTEDFAAAISEPNGKDFTQFKLWYNQSGTPVVKIQDSYDAGKKEYKVTLTQNCPPTPHQPTKKPFHIPMIMGLLNSQGQELALNCKDITQNTDGKFLIELKKETQDFIFTDINEKPYLSILREFSAPVNLQWETSDNTYYFLMANDTDSFNRRESAQRMNLKVLSKLISQFRDKQQATIDEKYLAAFKSIIENREMDPAFKALMMQLPADTTLALQEPVLDAEAFLKARKFLKKTIAEQNQQSLMMIYKDNLKVDAAKNRDLKNTALSYLIELNTAEIWSLVSEQYYKAQNMTDRMYAMNFIARSESSERSAILNDFLNNWKADSVVINKWFTAQANSNRVNTLNEVKALCQHPSFNINNPNNVYSLLRSFGSNITRFYESGTDAFEFYADKIIEIDSKNPQVAARLCAAFNFVKKLDHAEKEKALTEIRRIVATPSLSKNSRELLESAL